MELNFNLHSMYIYVLQTLYSLNLFTIFNQIYSKRNTLYNTHYTRRRILKNVFPPFIFHFIKRLTINLTSNKFRQKM